MTSNVEVDSNCLVVGFPYHDGLLESVTIVAEDILLALRSLNGDIRWLILRRVSALCVDGMRQGNTILNLRIIPVARAIQDTATRELLSSRLFLEPQQALTRKVLFLLESSYGADIVALCDGANVRVDEGAWAILAKLPEWP